MRSRLMTRFTQPRTIVVTAVLGLSAWGVLPGGESPSDEYVGVPLPYRPADVMSAAIPWRKIEYHAKGLKYNRKLGEVGHNLVTSDPGHKKSRADIFPVDRIWEVDEQAAKSGRIVAVIEASYDFPPLHLEQGSNYVMVWWDGDTPRMAVLNPAGRSEVTLDYTPHGGYSKAQVAKNLSPGALQCFSNGLKACFVDSRDAQIVSPPPSGGAMGIDTDMPQGFGSQPWVACLVTGCCCGGSNCH